MHIRSLTTRKTHPEQAGLRDTLEVTLLFLDVIGAAIGIINKEPVSGGSGTGDDHDDHSGHTH